MYTKAFVLSSLAILAAAVPGGHGPTTVTVTAAPTATTISQCNTGGDAQCCNTVGAANTLPGIGLILGLLGIVLQDLSVVVGLGCTSISGNNCNQQPVCCSNNNFNGLINIGCTPISL
ncbi:fungal hydrophobin [Ramaria rubella]|nr:fungal hydrophobin [Ramaria rubella]